MNPLEIFNQYPFDKAMLGKPQQNHKRRKYISDLIMKKELLSFLMINCKYTANYIANEIFKKKGYIVDAGTIIDKCKTFGIKTHSIEESANNPLVRSKYENTCSKKYGKINSLSKGTTSYKKRNRTIKKRYGVKNVFQLESVKNKSKKTLIKKYGVTSPIYLPTYERNHGRKSKIQKKIEAILSLNKIEFKSEVTNKFGKFNKKLNRFYSPIVDILLESKKIVIEINGDYWHGNPRIYKPNDKIKKWGGTVNASEIWKSDRIRNNQIRNFGYKVVILWEWDIINRLPYVLKKIEKFK